PPATPTADGTRSDTSAPPPEVPCPLRRAECCYPFRSLARALRRLCFHWQEARSEYRCLGSSIFDNDRASWDRSHASIRSSGEGEASSDLHSPGSPVPPATPTGRRQSSSR